MKISLEKIKSILDEVDILNKSLEKVKQDLYELLHEAQEPEPAPNKIDEKLLELQKAPTKDAQQADGDVYKINLIKSVKVLNNSQDMSVERKNIHKETKEILLKNGKVGQEYSDQINLNVPEDDKLIEIIIDDLDTAGLSLSENKKTIEGTLNSVGDFEWEIKYITEANPEEQKVYGKLFLSVIPDPKSLWQNIDPDSDAIYFKDNSYFEEINSSQNKIIACSVRGRSHAHVGSFREDHFVIKNLENSKWDIIAVSDGAGSSKYSREGSKIACETVSEEAYKLEKADKLELLDQLLKNKYSSEPSENHSDLNTIIYEIMGSTAFQAYTNIKEEAKSQGCDQKDYAATLMFTFTKSFEFGWVVISFWVGDGAVCVLFENEFELLGSPDGGEFAGQTRFVTMPDIFKSEEFTNRIKFRCYKNKPEAIILMTDGVSDPKFEIEDNLNDFDYWSKFHQEIKTKVLIDEDNTEKLVSEWINFWSPGNHDDRTIAMAIPQVQICSSKNSTDSKSISSDGK